MTRTRAGDAMTGEQQVIDAIAAAVPEWFGAGARLLPGATARPRSWSVHFPATVATPSGEIELIAKIPLWDRAPDLAAALAAGPQEATRAEFEALRRIEEMAAGEPALTAVRAIGYLPGVNALVTEVLPGTTLRKVRQGRAAVLRSVGIWLRKYHDTIGAAELVPATGEDVERLLAGVDPPADAPDALRTAVAAVSHEAGSLKGHAIRRAVTHGDLGPSNVLIDPQGKVAVIDPNLDPGPVEADLAKLAAAMRTSKARLLLGMGGSLRSEAALPDGYGSIDPEVMRLCSRIAVIRRWIEVEAGTTGLRRVALPIARLVLRRALSNPPLSTD